MLIYKFVIRVRIIGVIVRQLPSIKFIKQYIENLFTIKSNTSNII